MPVLVAKAPENMSKNLDQWEFGLRWNPQVKNCNLSQEMQYRLFSHDLHR